MKNNRVRFIFQMKFSQQYWTELVDTLHTYLIKKPGPDPVLGKDGQKKVVEWLINIFICGLLTKI